MSIPVVGTDAPEVIADYYGMSVKEMTQAGAIYMSGYTGNDIAQQFGLDRESCCVTWPTSTVPNIVGLTVTAADAAITAAGLTKGTATAAPGTLNVVLTQDPAAGVDTGAGDAVDYTYGDGT